MSDRRPSRPRRRQDAGTVTAETAVTIPSLVVLLAITVWVVIVVTAQLRVVDAARAGARAAARGETDDRVVAVAEAIAPPHARAEVSRSDAEVRVEVAVLVEPLGGLPILPVVPVRAVAYAAVEGAAGSTDATPDRTADLVAVARAGSPPTRLTAPLAAPVHDGG